VPRGPAGRYRPGRMLPLAIGTALLVVLAALVVFVAGGPEQAASPVPARPLGPAKTPADRAARAMPPGEQSFIAAIDRGRAAYQAGATEAERAAARSDRAGEICRAVPNPHVFAWSGVVEAVSPSFVSIEIAPNIRLATRAGAEAPPAIDPYVLQSLSTLEPGQAVAFSGIFLPSRPGEADCYQQAMPAPSDAMTAPVFIIGLYGIAAFKASAPAERSK
jgi:hypothetical protein